MAEIEVRRVGDREDDGGALWHASVLEGDATEVIDVHVDEALDSGEFDVEQVVVHRVERELEEVGTGPDMLGDLRERSPLSAGIDELDRWRGL